MKGAADKAPLVFCDQLCNGFFTSDSAKRHLGLLTSHLKKVLIEWWRTPVEPWIENSEILKPSKKPLNFPSASIWPQLSTILSFGLLSTSSMGCYQLYKTRLHQFLIKGFTVIGLITNQLVWSIRRQAAIDRLFNQFHFMRRGACDTNGDRKTRSVCDCHDLGPFATLCFADSKADSKTPFFAGTKLPSMNASLMSILPRSYRSSASADKISGKFLVLSIPGNVDGRSGMADISKAYPGISFQGAPVRNIHNIPFITSLAGFNFRPRGSFLGVDRNIMGSIRIHCSFVSSILILLHILDVMSSVFYAST